MKKIPIKFAIAVVVISIFFAVFLCFHYSVKESLKDNFYISKQTFINSGINELKLDKYYLTDATLVEMVAKKLAENPKIQQVVSVEKVYPAKLIIKYIERTPYAAIHTKRGFYPVDETGTLLGGPYKSAPLSITGYFITGLKDINHFEKELLTIIKPLFSDTDIAKNIKSININNGTQIELITKNGCVIHWGRNDSREISAQDKIENLKKIIDRYPCFEGLDYVKIYVKNVPVVKQKDATRTRNQQS